MSRLWPLMLCVGANTLYHIVTRSTPQDANTFLSLTVTYLVGAVCSLVLFLTGRGGESLSSCFSKLNWTTWALGIVIVGLELSWILIYRAGWKVSAASLICNIALAAVLLFVGLIGYREAVSFRQYVGIAVCVAGLVLIGT